MSVRLLLLIICLALLPTTAVGKLPDHTGKIIKFGIFKLVEHEPRRLNPNSPTGDEGSSNDVTIVDEVDRIPANLGIQFGILYELQANSPGQKVKIEEIYTFPGHGIRNSVTGEMQQRLASSREVYLNAVNLMAYELTLPAEVVTGVWNFEVKVKGATIITKQFYLYAD